LRTEFFSFFFFSFLFYAINNFFLANSFFFFLFPKNKSAKNEVFCIKRIAEDSHNCLQYERVLSMIFYFRNFFNIMKSIFIFKKIRILAIENLKKHLILAVLIYFLFRFLAIYNQRKKGWNSGQPKELFFSIFVLISKICPNISPKTRKIR